jgi:hypothetical protein
MSVKNQGKKKNPGIFVILELTVHVQRLQDSQGSCLQECTCIFKAHKDHVYKNVLLYVPMDLTWQNYKWKITTESLRA